MPENWPGLRGYADHQASSPTPIPTNPQLIAAWEIPGLHPWTWAAAGRETPMGIRCANLAIRDGKVALLIGGEGPENWWHGYVGARYRPYIGIFDLTTGEMVGKVLSQHRNGGGILTGTSVMWNSDTPTGCNFAYWGSDGALYLAYGGDKAFSSGTYIDSGNAVLPNPAMAVSPNASGCFAMSEDPRNWWRGYHNGHDYWEGATAHGFWANTLLRGDMQWRIKPATIDGYKNGYGTAINVQQLTPASTQTAQTFTAVCSIKDLTRTMEGGGSGFGTGSPRATALDDQGRVVMLGHMAKNVAAPGATPIWTHDYTQGLFLWRWSRVGTTTKMALDMEIRLGDSPLGTTNNGALAFAKGCHYSICLSPGRATVLQHKQNISWLAPAFQARKWRVDLDAGKLLESVSLSDDSRPAVFADRNSNTEQAVQMVMAGGEDLDVWAEEYGIAHLVIAVRRASGVMRIITTIGASTSTPPVLRSLAAVDGLLVALVDVEPTRQAVVVIG